MRQLCSFALGLVLLVASSVGASTLVAVPAQAADTCAAALGQFNTAAAAHDLDAMAEAYRGVTGNGTCDQNAIYCSGNTVALGYLDKAYSLSDSGATSEAVGQALALGKTFGSPWQLLVALGDSDLSAAQQEKDGAKFQSAAAIYQEALDAINEDQVCQGGVLPEPAQIASISQKMTEALLLAPTFEVIKTRDGGCGGIFLNSIRGFTPKFHPLPINFEFDSATFTPAGKKAAQGLLDCLKSEPAKPITLTGHTDPVGTDAYNMDLSSRRLAAVAAFLKEGGFTGAVSQIPKGESEPFEPDDPTAYTQDQLYQLDRRVELSGNVE